MQENINYNRVAEAIRFLYTNHQKQPSLEEVAEHIHVSPFHFQRMFTEWSGISPKKFLQYLTVEELKRELSKTKNLFDAAEKSGLSAQSRIYDLFVNIEAVTPNEFKTKGKGIQIEYGLHDTPFGECFIANTNRGICSLQFTDENKEMVINEFAQQWANANLYKDQQSTKKFVKQLFYADNQPRHFSLLLKGTKFQIKVWEALLKIPFGSVASYQMVASSMEQQNATRATGTAIGKNPVAFLIPCHRVIRNEGIIGNYHWGTTRKQAIIGWEKAKQLSEKRSMAEV